VVGVLQALRDPLRVFTDFVVTPASYIVFTDGARYYAKNGSTGAVEYSDTDASNVFQYAVDKLKGVGGAVFIRSGVYVFSKSVRLWSGIHVVGEARGGVAIEVPGTKTSARGVTIRAKDTSVSHAFVIGGGDYCSEAYTDIELRNLWVDGAGVVKMSDNIRDCGGVSDAIIENVVAWYWRLYPSMASIYAIDIWNSLFMLIKHVWAIGGPVLRFAQNTSGFSGGNSVIEDIFSQATPSGVPNILVGNYGDVSTAINLLVFIRPQTLASGAGFWLDGETGIVRDVTIIGGNFENTPGLVLRGRVSRVFADMHYPWGMRLCKNTAGNTPALPLYFNGKIPYDGDGRIIVYESDCQTVAGARVLAGLPVVGTDLNLLPYVSFVYPSPATILLDIDGGVMDLTRTSVSGSGVYGADNAPLRHPSYVARVPAGTTLQPGVNRFYFYTFYAPKYTPPYPAVYKWSGWDQANLDVQARSGSFIAACNCWQVIVEVINRSGTAITLTSHLDMLILTYYVRW
jgi:hypothetical protein